MNNTAANITVIIVNWNGAAFLEKCLTALSRQSLKPSQIIVIDNASTDNSLDIIAQFKNLDLLAQSSNVGFAAANNIGIQHAKHDWIALLNPDAYPETDWLKNLYQASVLHPHVDVFCSQLLNAADPTLVDGQGDVYHVSGLVWRKNHGKPASTSDQTVHEIFSACAAAALYSRQCLMAVNGFDENFYCYVEDIDLGFRLRLAGYTCLYIPTSIALHVGSGTTGGKHSDFAVYHGHRNLVWTYIKNMPISLFWLFLPVHLLLNIITILYFIFKGQGRIIIRAKYDALLGISTMLPARKNIQRNKKINARMLMQQIHYFRS